mmetsp:Transcript_12058/g.25927  ORF Transcript_12058/g.25927 Transcript_12058/m.25927 type:complete len:83 (-) Transcript_12058:1082-1330(-)
MLSSIPIILPPTSTNAVFMSPSSCRLSLSAISPPPSDTSPQVKTPRAEVQLVDPLLRTYPRDQGQIQPIPPGRMWTECDQRQ